MASEHRRAVGIFPDRPRTASALQALSDSGFAMSHVSVIAKDPERQNAIAGVKVQDEVSNQADTGGAIGAVTGGVLGGVTGLLIGLGTLTIPGIGPALLAGEAATVLSTLIGGAAGMAAGGLVGGLIGMGIPEHRAKHYQDRIAQGDYLVMLKDTEPEIARAERTLKAAGIEDWGVYQVSPSPSPTDHHPTHPDLINRQESGPSPVEQRLGLGYPLEGRDRTMYDDHPWQAGPSPVSNSLQAEGNPYLADALEADERRIVGTFRNQELLVEALSYVQQIGFPLQTLAILTREADTYAAEGHLGHLTSPLRGIPPFISGGNHVSLPELGSALVMGPDADALTQIINASSQPTPAKVLAHLGIPPETAGLYSHQLVNGAYLVTLRGHHQDLLQVASTLGEHGMQDWGIYGVRHG